MNAIHLGLPVQAPASAVLDAIEHPERIVGRVKSLESVSPLSDHPSERNYEWRFDLDGLPVRLVQHRVRDNEHNAIRTRRIDGDLAEFDATWRVLDINGASELRLDAIYRIGLPIDFSIAGTFHQHMTRFSMIVLEAMKHQAEAASERDEP